MGKIVVRGSRGLTEDVAKVLELIAKRVRYIELFNEVPSIPANSDVALLEYKVPSGYAMEVFAIGVQPDYDPATGISGLEYVYFKEAKGKAIPDMEFYANFFYNSLPYGDRASKQPIRTLDTPLKPGNLTLKFIEGEVFQIRGVTRDNSAGKVRVRAKAYLLEEEDVKMVYGCDFHKFNALPGGYANAEFNFIYAKPIENTVETSGAGKFEEIATITVPNWQRILLSHIGVRPHANCDMLKIVDERSKIEFPEREPYFVIREEANSLPFGSHNDYQPIQPLPPMIAAFEWNNTTMHFMMSDRGKVPKGGVKIQLLGLQRKVS